MVHAVTTRGATGAVKPCYRCGKKGHASKDCRFKDVKCHKCGKIGHIAPACRSKGKVSKANQSDYPKVDPKKSNPKTQRVYLITGLDYWITGLDWTTGLTFDLQESFLSTVVLLYILYPLFNAINLWSKGVLMGLN